MNRYRRFIKPILLLLILTLVIPAPLIHVDNTTHASSSTGDLRVAVIVEYGSATYLNFTLPVGWYRIEICRLTSAGWRWGVKPSKLVTPSGFNFALVSVNTFGTPCWNPADYNATRVIKIGDL